MEEKFKGGMIVYAPWYGAAPNKRLAVVVEEGLYSQPGGGRIAVHFYHYDGYGEKGNYDYHSFSENSLEHAYMANTEIARKLYPHYEENGEWLMIKEQK